MFGALVGERILAISKSLALLVSIFLFFEESFCKFLPDSRACHITFSPPNGNYGKTDNGLSEKDLGNLMRKSKRNEKSVFSILVCALGVCWILLSLSALYHVSSPGVRTLSFVSTPRITLPSSPFCIYYIVQQCLKEGNTSVINGNMLFAELDAEVTRCVLQWSQSRNATTEADSNTTVSLHINDYFPFTIEGRGMLKDRVDWILFRQSLYAKYNTSVCQNGSRPPSTNATFLWQKQIFTPPHYWRSSTLPDISNGSFGGSTLPPWYAPNDDQALRAIGYRLPFAPIKSIGQLRKRFSPTQLFYWNALPNLGDCVNEFLVNMLSGATTNFQQRIQRGNPSNTPSGWKRRFCVTGSILGERCRVIWGSGLIHNRTRTNISRRSRADILAVRGPDTWAMLSKRVQAKQHRPVFGDPGLLVSLIVPPKVTVTKQFDVCIVPHYVDQRHLWIYNSTATVKYSIQFLNIATCELKEFIDRLVGCRRILSSSLHGLIFGLAYGIPGMRIRLSKKVVGNNFKFLDFYRGIGHEELYIMQDLQNTTQFPMETLIEKIDSLGKMPELDMEDLWNRNPFHAERLGLNREEHVQIVLSYLKNRSVEDYYQELDNTTALLE